MSMESIGGDIDLILVKDGLTLLNELITLASILINEEDTLVVDLDTHLMHDELSKALTDHRDGCSWSDGGFGGHLDEKDINSIVGSALREWPVDNTESVIAHVWWHDLVAHSVEVLLGSETERIHRNGHNAKGQ